MSSQRNGKYSCIELERRFLVRALPAEVASGASSWEIFDRYLPGTRLRLRRMESSDGLKVVRKLTQKYSEAGAPAVETTITNLYLTEAEYQALETLGGKLIRKHRYTVDYEGRHYSVDVFDDHLRGLILAEAEAETSDALAELDLPPFFEMDVTADPFFTGGALCTVSADQLRQHLAASLP